MPNTDFQNGVILGSVAGGNIQTSSPSGEISITENGEYNVTNYASASVNVEGAGIVIEDYTLNQDGTYTFTDKDGNEHTLEFTEDADGNVLTATLDNGHAVNMTYDNEGNLIGVGAIDVDVSDYVPKNSGDNPFSLTEYIASSGTQYIDTGYVVQANTRFEIVYTATITNNYPTLFGARIAYQNNACQVLLKVKNTNYGTYSWTNQTSGSDENQIGSNSWSDIKTVLTVNQSGLLMQSQTFYQVIGRANAYSGTPNNNLPIFIFTLNDGGSAGSECYATAKLYRFRIYEGDTLVHEFVPHIDENDVVCLKDTVTNVLKYNAGTGTFTYGADV